MEIFIKWLLNKLRFKGSLIVLIASLLSALSMVQYITSFREPSTSANTAGASVVDRHSERNQPAPPLKIVKLGQVLVAVDAGHGGDDLGAIYGNIYEKSINLDIALRLGKILEQSGIGVLYIRKTDSAVEPKERAKIANDMGADLFISIHNNEMPNDPDYKGTETLFCPLRNQSEEKFDGEKLAAIVQKELTLSLKTRNNGIISRPNLAVLWRTHMPSVIAEIVYISNDSDRKRILQDDFRTTTAQALSRAVHKFLDIMGAKLSVDGKFVIDKNLSK